MCTPDLHVYCNDCSFWEDWNPCLHCCENLRTCRYIVPHIYIQVWVYVCMNIWNSSSILALNKSTSYIFFLACTLQFLHMYSLFIHTVWKIFLLNCHVFTYFISQKDILPFFCLLTPTQNPIMQETQHLCVWWHSRKIKYVSWSTPIQSTCSTPHFFF